MRERQQMASRPFASVDVALEVGTEEPDIIRGPLEGVPKPIAVEPCSTTRAAVLTVFICLPRGSCGTPPPGQSGLAIASALIDISQQKPGECKEKTSAFRNRKQLPPKHQGTCV
uniref:Attractin-like protein 1 n=2 Tax=Callorhinchus milii TaxID=7868 RepID=A0A4W3JJJ7_CALMI